MRRGTMERVEREGEIEEVDENELRKKALEETVRTPGWELVEKMINDKIIHFMNRLTGVETAEQMHKAQGAIAGLRDVMREVKEVLEYER